MERHPEKDRSLPASMRAGRVLAGKYRVEWVLGRGGMGIVVAATHLLLGELVAVKLLLLARLCEPMRSSASSVRARGGADPERACGARSRRRRPRDGEPYLVLEYLDGLDLRALLRERGRLSVDTAVLYVLQICEALAEAHSLGIIHRDLKPGNIFLTRRADGSEVVKVIDFGISKIAAPSVAEGEASPLTTGDSAMGTPSYMAPEQMRSARAVDARADLWSLRAVLFELLTGASPFAGETMIEVYDRILKGAPSLCALRGDVPPGLEEVVLRCLRFDRDARYEDIGQLAAALAELAPPAGRLSAERALRIARGAPLADEPLVAERLSEGESGAAVKPADGEVGLASAAPSTLERGVTEESFASECPTTGVMQEPSWLPGQGRAHEPSRPASISAPPAIARAASAPRASINRWPILLFAGSVALTCGGAAAVLATRDPPMIAGRPASSTPGLADHERISPAQQPLPSVPVATAALVPSPPSLTVSALASALSAAPDDRSRDRAMP